MEAKVLNEMLNQCAENEEKMQEHLAEMEQQWAKN